MPWSLFAGFNFLSGFRPFELETVAPLTDFDYDAVVCDPPFANFELSRLSDALVVLAGGDQKKLDAPLYIAYNSRREKALQQCFSAQRLERKLKLGYCSVKQKTQQHLWLYGPLSVAS
eukprot:CAMPEP_0115859596 /NCGR_PEP_ID=MMETSP0287-20121206/16697_1 /TAXON_ID=412157 /ORGANISM="Chrysochromulina rotalis, Strain UIO044" /LENGTH=117 /DNA_ID=CAMNT_0003313901 /DNA_START=460 /DNA_END=817 /DNA_ORIENTATION=-